MTSGSLDYSIYYNHWHDGSARHRTNMVRLHRRQLGELLDGVDRQLPIFEVGAGMGFAMLALQELGFRTVRGTDADPKQVAACVANGLDVQVEPDVEIALRTVTGELGAALMLDVLEHMDAQAQLHSLRAIKHCLSPGAPLVLTVPNALHPLAAYWRYNDYTHSTSFTPHSLKFLLINAGFESVEIRGGGLRRPSLRLWRGEARADVMRWLTRRAWTAVIRAELGPEEARFPIDLNITAVAR